MESSSEQGASEADIDSDSGYCSPKHSNQAAGVTSRSTESAASNVGKRLKCLKGMKMAQNKQNLKISSFLKFSDDGTVNTSR